MHKNLTMREAIDIWSILTIVVRVTVLSIGNTIDYVARFVDYNVSSPEKRFNYLINGKQSKDTTSYILHAFPTTLASKYPLV